MCPAGVNAHPAAGHMGPALQGAFLALCRGGRPCPPVGDGVLDVPHRRGGRLCPPKQREALLSRRAGPACPAGVNAHPAAGHMGPALQGDFLALCRDDPLSARRGRRPRRPASPTTRKSRPPGRLFCCIYSSKGTPNICQNCRFSLSDTMAEFHEPNVKLAQLSVPFSTDTVRPSSKVTVSLAVNQQAAPPP